MQNPEGFIHHKLGKRFEVKPNSIRTPTLYLGNKVSYVTLENGRNSWIFSSSHYVQDAVKNVIGVLSQRGVPDPNAENLLGLVTTDPRIILPLSSLLQ